MFCADGAISIMALIINVVRPTNQVHVPWTFWTLFHDLATNEDR